MKIGCLQFNPQVGDVENNIKRAEAILADGDPKDLDLLILPEMAFSGYNFKSLEHISPYLEPTVAGTTAEWAKNIAMKYGCVVVAGYPEKAAASPVDMELTKRFNSAILVHPQGTTIANYRKSFLYYTDETWADESPDSFFSGEIEGLGRTVLGICMDLNPYKFKAPWVEFEFAHHALRKDAELVIVSMAWSTLHNHESYTQEPQEPDIDSLIYWAERLAPIIRGKFQQEIIVVLANRCGSEGDTVYVGTSCVLGIKEGEVSIYGILGRGEERLLLADTQGSKNSLWEFPDLL